MRTEASGGLEVELAVTRGRDYVARGVFGPGSRVSIGRTRGVALRFDDPEVPDAHELFRVASDGGLFFEADMRVEISRDGRILTTPDLIGDARVGTDGAHILPLERGLKGLVRFGQLGFLFKVQPARDAEVFRVDADARACGSCGAPLKHVLVGGGARTPCAACGALTEVGGRPPASDEEAAETVSDLGSPARRDLDLPTFDAIEASRAGDLPTFDAIGARKAQDLPTFDAIGARKAQDLPTFDAIGARKAQDLPTFDAIGVRKAQDLPTFDAIAARSPDITGPDALAKMDPADARTVQARPIRGPGFAELAADPAGADLPTFDAISVVRDEGFSTQAAISVLRGGESSPAPVKLGPAVLVEPDSEAPVPSAELDQLATAPALQSLRSGPQSLGPGDLPDDPVEVVKQSAGLSTDAALEWMRGGSGERPPTRTTEEITGSTSARPAEEQEDLFGEAFSQSTRAPNRARGVSLPRMGAVPVPGPKTSGSIPAAGGGDDFLMGRTDLETSELAQVAEDSGIWLYVVGIGAGLVGVALIAYRVLFS